jgi:hypothetical protein
MPLASSSREDLIKPVAVVNNFNVLASTNPDSTKIDTSMYVGPGARAQLYRDRIEAMTIDNSSLQRRLNQVGAELDRITDEKEELLRQLNFHKNDNDRI